MLDKLRILWLNWRDTKNPAAGGAEIFTHEVAKRLVKQGWNITLFTSIFSGAESEEAQDGVEIVRRGSGLSVYSNAKDYYRKYGKDFDLVVDEINTRPFMTPTYIQNLPVVALIHQMAREYWFYETPWPLSWFGYYWLERAWLRNYRNIKTVTVSNSTKKDLVRAGFADVNVVSQGLSVPVCDDIPEKDATPTALFVGRLKRVKKPDHAIMAFKSIQKTIPSAKLWCVGEGYMRPELELMAGDGVEFWRRVDDRTKVHLMDRALILLFPSVREGWGMVLTEAMARGTPPVAYDVPGARDAIICGETGVLVEYDNWKKMAEETIRLLQDAKQRQAMARRGLEFARNLSWEKATSEFAEICLLAGRSFQNLNHT